MKTIPLAEVVQINPRPPTGLHDAQEISFLAMASISEDGSIARQETRLLAEVKRGFTYFQRGDVLLAKITPCFENGKAAGTDQLLHPFGFGSTEFHVLRAVPGKLDARFLYHLVRSTRFRYLGQKSMKGAAGHKRVPVDFVANFEIPALSITDQIRIAHLLGKVEGLIAQRKQHLQQLDDLLKSVFLEMFGDPMRNEKGWRVHPCDKAVLDISSGTSYGGEDRPFLSADEVGVLKISAVTKGRFDPTEFKVVDPSQVTKPPRFVKQGDFLFSRANTVELVAACCIVPADYPQLFLPDKLWVLTLNSELVSAQFFNYLLKNERYRDTVRSLASGGHDSMLNISMKKFITLDVPCPPIDIQSQFATIVESSECLRSRYQQSLVDLEAFYSTLTQKAFKGELDLSRVLPNGVSIEQGNEQHASSELPPVAFDSQIPIANLDTPAEVTPERRSQLVRQWFSEWVNHVTPAGPVSPDVFWETARLRALDYQGDEPIELGLSDYEQIKIWVFDALSTGKLKQAFDDERNRIELKSAQA
jgi:type I restriction enzyme S subunit